MALRLSESVSKLKGNIAALFVTRSGVSAKPEVNTKTFRRMAIIFAFIFITVVMLMPEKQNLEFTEKLVSKAEPGSNHEGNRADSSRTTSGLWASPSLPSGPSRGKSQVNHNTSMILGSKTGNAKVQLRAGIRLPLRVVDQFIVSQEPVPILAELLIDALTDSGLSLPAGTRFYGEASFQKGRERATVQFRQVSLPDGQIRHVSGIALGKDGQPGIVGRVYSDGFKNTAGQVLTTFVGGLAAGSIETDVLGRSKGGLENGVLTAIAATAKDRAQAYGEKMKTEREWIEVLAGAECDVLLSESMNLQQGFSE